MGQLDYDAFKQRLREWMEANSEECSAFEAEMNRMDGAGYRKIMAVAVSLAPKYRKAVERKMATDGFTEVASLETMLSDARIGKQLMSVLENPGDATIPAMLCWLYFGRSFENMIEMGEELMPAVSRFQQFGIAFTTRLLISRSISLGFRTKQQWCEYKRKHLSALDGISPHLPLWTVFCH